MIKSHSNIVKIYRFSTVESNLMLVKLKKKYIYTTWDRKLGKKGQNNNANHKNLEASVVERCKLYCHKYLDT